MNYLKSVLSVYIVLLTFLAQPYRILGDNVNSQSELNNYLIYASANNHGLKSAFNLWKAEMEKSLKVRILPDPIVSFAYFISKIETKVGPQNMKFGITQKFPWFGKLALSGKRSLEKAKALKQNFEKVKLNLFYEVKKRYFNLGFNIRSIQIIEENIYLLKLLNSQVESLYTTGKTSSSRLIGLQVELDKLLDMKRSLLDKQLSLKIALNAVMNRPIKTEITIDKNCNEINFFLDSDELRETMVSNNPELKYFDHLELSEKAGLKLAKKNSFPDISIGADLIVTGDSVNPDLINSGKDPFMVKISINLPIWFKKIKASVREAKFRVASINEKMLNRKNRLIEYLEQTLFSFNDSVHALNLYKNKIIPKVKKAFEITKTAFTNGEAGFLEFIDIQRTLLQFRLNLEKAKINSVIKLALIESIVGKDISENQKKIRH